MGTRLATRAIGSNAATFTALCRASPGARTIVVGDVCAVVTPATPERPLFNAAFGLAPGGIARAYADVAAIYRDAGVGGWTTFADPQDDASIAALSGNGHVLDGVPRLMGTAAARIRPRSVAADVRDEPDAAVVAALNDTVYGYPGSFGRAVCSLDGLRALVAVDGGRAVSCAVAHETDGDCHVTLVATLPTHRGRGLAGALVTRLVRSALERGCDTTTLVATRTGMPLYERLGYEELGGLEMWERTLAP